jgi:hypothetical protein
MATLDKINRILQAQDDIKTQCKCIMDAQSETDDTKLYIEHQTQLNRLFVQHMELVISASGLLAAEEILVRTCSVSYEP